MAEVRSIQMNTYPSLDVPPYDDAEGPVGFAKLLEEVALALNKLSDSAFKKVRARSVIQSLSSHGNQLGNYHFENPSYAWALTQV